MQNFKNVVLIRNPIKMAVTGFDINTVEAKRYTKQGERIQNLRIDQNSTVIVINNLGDDTAALEFRFTANYVNVGIIKIEGKVIWKGDADSLIEEWSKSHNMPTDIASQVHTAIISHCMPAAVVIARDIGLPPPLPPIPPLQMRKKQSARDRQHSPEIV